jgi:hypothetical protein
MVSFSLEEAQKLAEELGGKAKTEMEGFIAAAEKAGSETVVLAGASKELTSNLESLGAITSVVSQAIDKFVQSAGGGFKVLTELIEGSGSSMGEMGLQAGLALEPLLDLLPRGSKAFGKLAEAGTASSMQITTGYDAVQKKIEGILKLAPDIGDKLGTHLAASIGRFAQTADAGFNLQRNLVAVSASVGDLEPMLDETGDGFGDLTAHASSFATQIYGAAQASGRLLPEVANIAVEMKKIPGAMEGAEKGMDGVIQKSASLSDVLKVAAAYHVDAAEVTEKLQWAYRQLGTATGDALGFVANMYAAVQDLNIPMKTMEEYTKRSAEAFKFMGDQTEGAINIMRGMGQALKDSGMGPDAIASLSQSMVDGISRMDIAHKAFVSGATGGKGGLAGAYEIEYLLTQPGGMAQVMEKTMSAMQRQFGAPPVTLEDVHRTPALAGQLLKQVSFLRDVAGIAGSDQEAYRILEGMKKGAPEMMVEARETPEQQLGKAVERGNQEQTRTNTLLTKIANYQSAVVMLQGQLNATLVTKTLGTAGPMGAMIKRGMEGGEAREREAERGRREGVGIGAGAFTEEIVAGAKAGMAETGDALRDALGLGEARPPGEGGAEGLFAGGKSVLAALGIEIPAGVPGAPAGAAREGEIPAGAPAGAARGGGFAPALGTAAGLAPRVAPPAPGARVLPGEGEGEGELPVAPPPAPPLGEGLSAEEMEYYTSPLRRGEGAGELPTEMFGGEGAEEFTWPEFEPVEVHGEVEVTVHLDADQIGKIAEAKTKIALDRRNQAAATST